MNKTFFPEYSDANKFPVASGIAVFQALNIFSILLVIEYYFGIKIMKKREVAVGLFLFFVLVNYFLLIWKGKDKKIYSLFENERGAQKKWGIFLTWLYIIGTWTFVFYAIYL